MPDNNLKDLAEKIDRARRAGEPVKGEGPDAEAQNVNTGMRAGSELVISIVASAALGYGIDKWLGTKPWGFIILLLLGIGAGFMAVYRITNNAGDSVGFTALQNREKASTKRPENRDNQLTNDDSP